MRSLGAAEAGEHQMPAVLRAEQRSRDDALQRRQDLGCLRAEIIVADIEGFGGDIAEAEAQIVVAAEGHVESADPGPLFGKGFVDLSGGQPGDLPPGHGVEHIDALLLRHGIRRFLARGGDRQQAFVGAEGGGMDLPGQPGLAVGFEPVAALAGAGVPDGSRQPVEGDEMRAVPAHHHLHHHGHPPQPGDARLPGFRPQFEIAPLHRLDREQRHAVVGRQLDIVQGLQRQLEIERGDRGVERKPGFGKMRQDGIARLRGQALQRRRDRTAPVARIEERGRFRRPVTRLLARRLARERPVQHQLLGEGRAGPGRLRAGRLLADRARDLGQHPLQRMPRPAHGLDEGAGERAQPAGAVGRNGVGGGGIGDQQAAGLRERPRNAGRSLLDAGQAAAGGHRQARRALPGQRIGAAGVQHDQRCRGLFLEGIDHRLHGNEAMLEIAAGIAGDDIVLLADLDAVAGIIDQADARPRGGPRRLGQAVLQLRLAEIDGDEQLEAEIAERGGDRLGVPGGIGERRQAIAIGAIADHQRNALFAGLTGLDMPAFGAGSRCWAGNGVEQTQRGDDCEISMHLSSKQCPAGIR